MVSSKQNVAQLMVANANDQVRSHSFPLKIEEWLAVMTFEEFVPTKHSRIYGDYITSSDYYPSSCLLLKTSIPSG